MTQTVLILGASGRFGRHATHAFGRAGWQVRQFTRGGDLLAAAQGADLIVNAWNPAYGDWAKAVPQLTEEVIAAAKASGATVLIPANVYVYGEDMPEKIGPGVAHRAENPLGRIRRDMEEAYRHAGVRTILLRAGDFIDTEASGNWFDKVLAAQIAKGRFSYPGPTDVPHAWAYLPDLAQAAVAVAERRADLPVFADLAFAGYTMSAEEMAAAISAAMGREVVAKRMSWLPIHLARPFWRIARHLLEMRYLWRTPHSLDGSELAKVVPDLRNTSPVEAMHRAIRPLLRQRDQIRPASDRAAESAAATPRTETIGQ